MKGKLYRKTEGWMVFYVEKNSAYTSTSYQKSLPLHPDNSTVILYEKHPLDWDGKEVDFEIVNESWDGYKGCTYAKLINQVPDVRKMVEDDVKTTTSDLIDSAIWSLPFEERMKCWDLIEKLVEEEKETLYTEEQVIEIVEKSRATGLTAEYIIQSLKQPKQ